MWNGPSGFGYGSTAEQVTDGLSLNGKTYLVTGCNSGLGFETMRVLALRGAHVIGTARTLEKAQDACAQVVGSTSAVACELSEPGSVRECVSQVQAQGHMLDACICNAGIMALPNLERAHGYELQLFTNHIGHFLLVNGLLPSLRDTGRVVVVSSSAHRAAPSGGIEFDNLDGAKGYTSYRAYGQSKLANILFAKELSRRFVGSQRTANALHPGVIKTNLVRSMNPMVGAAMSLVNSLALKSIPQGAATQVYLATHPALSQVSGAYFADCNEASPRRDALDEGLARRLWDTSEAIVAGL